MTYPCVMAGMMRKGEGGGGRGREGEGEGLYLYHYRGWIEQGMKQFTGSPLPSTHNYLS